MPVGEPFHAIFGAVPTPEERARIDRLKEHFAELRTEIVATLPSNRERALALTHLEDACMRGVRAVLEGDTKRAG